MESAAEMEDVMKLRASALALMAFLEILVNVSLLKRY